MSTLEKEVITPNPDFSEGLRKSMPVIYDELGARRERYVRATVVDVAIVATAAVAMIWWWL